MKQEVGTNFTSRLLLVLILAFLVSFYLLYHFVAVKYGYQIDRSFCAVSGSFDCDEVARSKYSVFFGIPVAGWGIIFYSLFTYLLFVVRRSIGRTEDAAKFTDILFFMAGIAVIASLSLFAVSHFLIQKLCLFCCVLYFANLCLFVIVSLNNLSGLSVAGRFINGARGLFFGLSKVQSKNIRLIALVTVVGAYFSPELLVNYYFKPREARNSDRVLLEPLYQAWKSSLSRDVPFELDGPEPDFFLGNIDAKVVIVEFSDFECPICKSYARYIRKMFEGDLASKVLFISKAYPLDRSCNDQVKREMHKFACEASYYARCAGGGGSQRYWAVHDGLMDLFDTNKDTMKELILKLGVGDDSFNSCINQTQVKARVQQDLELGRKLGIPGTPAFFINGKQLPQIAPERFEGVVRMILKEP